MCDLFNDSAANTNVHIIAEVTPLDVPLEINSKISPEINSKINPVKEPEIFSKIDAVKIELIQAVKNASAKFKQLITRTRSGGRRKRTRRFKK